MACACWEICCMSHDLTVVLLSWIDCAGNLLTLTSTWCLWRVPSPPENCSTITRLLYVWLPLGAHLNSVHTWMVPWQWNGIKEKPDQPFSSALGLWPACLWSEALSDSHHQQTNAVTAPVSEPLWARFANVTVWMSCFYNKNIRSIIYCYLLSHHPEAINHLEESGRQQLTAPGHRKRRSKQSSAPQ